MKIFRLYITTLLFMLIFSDAKLFAQQLESADTLIVNEPCIIYWQLTMAEYDSVFEKSTRKIDSLFFEFNTITEKLAPFFKKKGLKWLKTDSRFISFSTSYTPNKITMDRKKLDDIFGVIINNTNQQPVFLPGVNSTLTIMKKMKECFPN